MWKSLYRIFHGFIISLFLSSISYLILRVQGDSLGFGKGVPDSILRVWNSQSCIRETLQDTYIYTSLFCTSYFKWFCCSGDQINIHVLSDHALSAIFLINEWDFPISSCLCTGTGVVLLMYQLSKNLTEWCTAWDEPAGQLWFAKTDILFTTSHYIKLCLAWKCYDFIILATQIYEHNSECQNWEYFNQKQY